MTDNLRRPIIAGNWKMNKDTEESANTVKSILSLLPSRGNIDVVVCPVFTSLSTVCSILKDTHISVGAQNTFWKENGAYTGEVSPVMIKHIGCSHVIVGHSERRQYFFETDKDVNKKIRAAIHCGLKSIVCIGETLKEREDGITYDIIRRQVQEDFKGIEKKDIMRVSIAYEPIWAIGTGRTAAPSQANEVHQFIRARLASLFDEQAAASVRILYGGSVKPENIKELIEETDIDGALVGGASLDAESFAQIVKNGGF